MSNVDKRIVFIWNKEHEKDEPSSIIPDEVYKKVASCYNSKIVLISSNECLHTFLKDKKTELDNFIFIVLAELNWSVKRVSEEDKKKQKKDVDKIYYYQFNGAQFVYNLRSEYSCIAPVVLCSLVKKEHLKNWDLGMQIVKKGTWLATEFKKLYYKGKNLVEVVDEIVGEFMSIDLDDLKAKAAERILIYYYEENDDRHLNLIDSFIVRLMLHALFKEKNKFELSKKQIKDIEGFKAKALTIKKATENDIANNSTLIPAIYKDTFNDGKIFDIIINTNFILKLNEDGEHEKKVLNNFTNSLMGFRVYLQKVRYAIRYNNTAYVGKADYSQVKLADSITMNKTPMTFFKDINGSDYHSNAIDTISRKYKFNVADNKDDIITDLGNYFESCNEFIIFFHPKLSNTTKGNSIILEDSNIAKSLKEYPFLHPIYLTMAPIESIEFLRSENKFTAIIGELTTSLDIGKMKVRLSDSDKLCKNEIILGYITETCTVLGFEALIWQLPKQLAISTSANLQKPIRKGDVKFEITYPDNFKNEISKLSFPAEYNTEDYYSPFEQLIYLSLYNEISRISGEKIITVSPLAEGYSGAYVFNTKFTDEEYVIKVQDNIPKLHRELTASSRLKELEVPIISAFRFNTPITVGKWGALVYEKVKGQELNKYFKKADEFNELMLKVESVFTIIHKLQTGSGASIKICNLANIKNQVESENGITILYDGISFKQSLSELKNAGIKPLPKNISLIKLILIKEKAKHLYP